MLNSKPLDKIIFLDIETTSQVQTFSELEPKLQTIFKKSFKKSFTEPTDPELIYNEKAPLYAEWGKIICISIGTIDISNKDEYIFKKQSFYGEDEHDLLTKFTTRLNTVLSDTTSQSSFHFCAHNGKQFDFPFISKRLLINKLQLPKVLDFSELKPWDLKYFIDSKEIWKFGVYDNNISLELLSHIFGVSSSKGDMDGSMVKDVYYVNKDIKKIVSYCESDIFSLASIFLKMKGDQTDLKIKGK